MESAQCSAADRAQVLQTCRDRVLKAAPDIIDALIAQATKGSCAHAKFLFDLLETAPAKHKDDEDDLPGPSLAQILLERLQLLEEESASPVTESGAQA